MILPGDLIRAKTYNGLRYDFYSWGVVAYADGNREVMRCRLADVVCGTVTSAGIFLATSTAGVWRVPHNGSGDITGTEVKRYGLSSGAPIQSDVCTWIDSNADILFVATDAGVDFIVDNGGTIYSFADASGVDRCAISSTHIAYTPSGGGIHYRTHPTADWVVGDVTILNTGSSPAILSNIIQALEFGTNLFIGTAAGVSVYDGANVANFTSTQLGTVVDVKALFPQSTATDTAGVFAYATSNGSDGGRFGIYDITGATNLDTVAGDAASAWLADDISAAAHDDSLIEYVKIEPLTPGYGAMNVRRDWSIYAEITDSLDGIQSGTVALTINGAAVTEVITAITDGYKVEYTPAQDSGYQERIVCVLTALDGNGNTITRAWIFTTEEIPAATVTDTAIPQVTCYRDISLSAEEAEEVIGTVNVVWIDDYVGSLIVDEAQAQAVGTIIIDDNTHHKRQRTIKTKMVDSNGDPVKELQEGQIITLHCPAIGMNLQRCEIMAKKRQFAKGAGGSYLFQVAYYEAV
jgi:hypothetical protein